VVGANYRVRFDSEPFVPSGFDRITVKTELSRAELSSGDCTSTFWFLDFFSVCVIAMLQECHSWREWLR
jgi:hypothetical protein